MLKVWHFVDNLFDFCKKCWSLIMRVVFVMLDKLDLRPAAVTHLTDYRGVIILSWCCRLLIGCLALLEVFEIHFGDTKRLLCLLILGCSL